MTSSGPACPGPLKALLPFALGLWIADRLWFGPGVLAGSPRFFAILALCGLGIVPLAWAGFRHAAAFPVLLLGLGVFRAALPLAGTIDPWVENLASSEAKRTITARVELVEARPQNRYRVRLFLLSVAADSAASPDSAGVLPMRRVAARAVVSWPETLDPPSAEDRLTFRASFRFVSGPTNPGEWNQRRYFERAGIRYRLSIDAKAAMTRDAGPVLSIESGLRGLRRAAGGSVDRRLDGFARRLTRVLLIGDRVSFLPEEENDFRRSGVVHILSVSGLHVGLVAATVQLLLGRRRRLSALVTALATIWGYTLLVGAPSAAVRSAAMLSLVLVARHRRRVISGVSLLAAASLLVLAASPGLLFDLGFLLSVFSVAGLLTAHHLLAAVPGLAAAPAAVRALASALGLTFGAQAATAPFVIPLWGDWPLVAPLANLLVVGVSDLVLTGGLMALAVDLFHPASADRVFAVVWAFSWFVGFAVHQLAAHSPGLSGLRPPPPFVPWAFGVFAIAAVMAFLAGRRKIGAFCAAGWLASFGLLVASPAGAPPGLRVTVMDVGQGDATLLEFPDGVTMLVDGGPGGDTHSGERVVRTVLRSARITRLDAVVLSHEHKDHQGGLVEILNLVPVERVFDSGMGPADGEPGAFRRLCVEKRAPICLTAAGDTLLRGPDYDVVALWPPRPVDPVDELDRPSDTLNDLSVVLLVTWRHRRLVLAGDLEEAGEHLFLGGAAVELPPPGPVDYLKVGHHGSRTSSSEEWLDYWRPRVASMSCGRKNRFRHPSRAVVERYARRGIALHRTDTGGALRLTFDDRGVRVERLGDGLFRRPNHTFVADGAAWPATFLDASGAIW